MRFKASLAVLACAASALGMAACSSSTGGSSASSSSNSTTTSTSNEGVCANPSSTAGTGSSSSSTTLTLEQSPTASISDNLNPFVSASAANTLGITDLIYDPLYQFDELKTGVQYPWLATGYKWSNGGKTITFTLRNGVKFSNGAAFNATDAAWEFNYIKANPSINQYGIPIASASAPNPATLVVNFTQSQYTNLFYIAGTVMVDPAQWKNVSNPGTYADTDPIGTGAYTLSSYTPQGLTLKANPSFWDGESHVPTIDVPVYTSNTTANEALENGTLDWAGNFVQNIKSEFLDKSTSNHCWDYGLQTETLIPNLNTFPFNGSGGLAVRQAIAYGVNRVEISNDGEDGQQPPAEGAGSLAGLTLPLDQAYVNSSVSQYTATYDPSKAESILKAAGWTMGSNGYFQKDGKTLAFTVEDPSEYTDFVTDDEILAASMKDIGIDVTIKQTTVPTWDADLADGDFNSMMHWGNGGISPYAMYDNWLDTTLDTGADAKNALGDYEHFSGPAANQAEQDLVKYAAATPSTTGAPTAQQISDVDALGKIIATDLPVIPLFYGVAWGDYSSSDWTGWPSPSNEYSPISPDGPENILVILKLRPAK
jgi:peptide/nickel transport system substrate-binding protein